MNRLQKGGLDPLSKVPYFKYTFNEKRKLFIGYIYPYADYFINCVTSIPYHSYSYDANCEYIGFEDKKQIISPCNSTGSPLYFFTGGCAYELLNKKFKNVDMHTYCDATADIDVVLFPPKLTYNPDGDVYFLNTDKKINSFYNDFTRWTFEKMIRNIRSIQKQLHNMEGIVNFDINEYDDIPEQHKNVDYGYNIQLIGKLYVVAFLNDDKTMFKIQVVCKIEDADISVIDHIIEIIIPVPENDDTIEFSPSGDGYNQPSINTIDLNRKTYNISSYSSLINDNISAYIERKNVYGKRNEREVIHKSINHIARLFYLYELIYQNQLSFPINSLPFLFLFAKETRQKTQLEKLYYYKIVDGNFNTIQVDTRFFLNAYLELILKNQYMYTNFKRTNPDYFITYTDLKKIHDRFIDELLNNDLFTPSGLLTFDKEDSREAKPSTKAPAKAPSKSSSKVSTKAPSKSSAKAFAKANTKSSTKASSKASSKSSAKAKSAPVGNYGRKSRSHTIDRYHRKTKKVKNKYTKSL